MVLTMNAVVQDLPEGFKEFYYQGTLFAYLPSTGEGYRAYKRGSVNRWGKISYYQILYAIVNLHDGRRIGWHRVLAAQFLNQGEPLEDWQVVDHILHATGEPSQDKISNLRITTISGNALNKRVAKTSKYRGVCFDKTKGKWRAQARHICTGCKKGLGYFDDEYQAHLAYEAYVK